MPRLNVVCFPPAGGAASSFSALRRAAGGDTAVTTVLLPGREARIGEPCATDLDRVVGTVAEELLPLLAGDDTPYVLLGHSMGGLLAYEAALRLDDLGARRPLRVVVAGTAAPRSAGWSAVASRGPEDLMRLLGGVPQEVFDSPELLEIVTRALRADLRMIAGHRCSGGLLRAPLSVLHGSEDPLVGAEAVADWADVAGAGATVTELAGGHFFLDAHYPRLLADWHLEAAR
ncbi:alpha/beta fold hydrolase [Streptomyces sp. NBC_00090]|uniref:thioesterase II family protein n=1 Tax=Streptomyces sp. NBC_00090 TaxID=2903619 RepID=UPI0032519E5A